MNISGKKCLVIGASSGIGAALSLELAKRGCSVALVARRQLELDRISGEINRIASNVTAKTYQLDVTDFESAPKTLDQISADFDGIDVAIYVAGAKVDDHADGFDTAGDIRMVEVNLLGAIAWLNPLAKQFSASKAGVIVGIGSAAGDRGRSAMAAYSASKAGLETYLEALRNRLGQHNIQVTTIKPGTVNTAMTAGSKVSRLAASPTKTALEIIKAIEKETSVAYTPKFWRLVMFFVRNAPSRLMQKIRY